MTQTEALDILKTGANVFLTGEPGSGKTHLVNEYIAYLSQHGIEPAITASTGIAATHIGGMTIHSWSGIGVAQELTDYDLDKISQNERAVRRLTRTKVLIIDEVSMLSAQTLSMVDAVLREVRRSSKPFGGLQVVLVGDFFQLPPVVKRATSGEDTQLDFEDSSRSLFAYNSPAWRALNPLVCYLTEQHRQEDPVFLEILSALRRNALTAAHKSALTTRTTSTAKPPQGITRLYSHNTDVDRTNDAELGKLAQTPRVFTMQSSGSKPLIEQLKRSCLSPETLTLKLGAKVMFTKNNPEEGYVNGTQGEVVGFDDYSHYPKVKTRSGRVIVTEPVTWSIEAERRALAEITQVPLRLAWAITVHKSQGMSLDAAVVDLSGAFEYGQGYVALSRVRTLSGLYLLGLNERALEVHPEILERDEDFREQSAQAQEHFSDMDARDVARLQKNFLAACGFVKNVVENTIRP